MALSNKTTITKHQELQVLAALTREGVSFHYDTLDIPELRAKDIRYRPDFVVRLATTVVIIEVDEDGHANYDMVAEVVRMKTLRTAFGTRTAFLRMYVEREVALSGTNLNRLLSSLYELDVLIYEDARMNVILLDYPLDGRNIYRGCEDCINLIKPQCMLAPSEESENGLVVIPRHMCGRCGANFSYKSTLKRHLENANTCPPSKSSTSVEELLHAMAEKDNERVARMHYCAKCGRGYTHKRNALSHEKKCARRSTVSEDDTAFDRAEAVSASTPTMAERVSQLERLVAKLERLIDELRTSD